MKTTKRMITFGVLIGLIQACSPTIEKTEEATEWLAIADSLQEAQYVELVQNHPMTQNVEDDLEQMGCSIEFDNSRVEETRVENESPKVRVRVPLGCGDSEEESASDELIILLGGDVILDVQHMSAEFKLIRALDTQIPIYSLNNNA